jgi:kynurenine formamidase
MTMATNTTSAVLPGLVAALLSGRIRVVDLTQTLTPDFPQIALPPEMGQCWPFRIEEVSAYDERGPGWYWNNFSCGEHTGTHFDAPIHWISGRDLPNNSVDTIPVQHFVAPACVIDCSEQVKADPDYLLDGRDIERFEARTAHPAGRLGADAHRLVQAQRPRGLPELRRDGPAHAGPEHGGGARSWSSSAACSASARRRSAPTPGRASPAPAVPVPLLHALAQGRYGLQCLRNLDLLPPTGAVLICPAAEDREGQRQPLRVLALGGGQGQ